MNILKIIFYLYAATALLSGLMVVISHNPVRAALFLVLAFISTAGIWMILHAEFLSLILVLVYVGAVMTLFLFVVMMLNIDVVSLKHSFVRYLPLSILIVLMLVGLIAFIVGETFGLSSMPHPANIANESNIANLGAVLYTQYAFPFEVAGVLLLTAIIAAISLTHRVPTKIKSQNPTQQINAKKEDRLRIIKMKGDGT